MSIYMLRGRYNSEALKGMMASSEDREAASSFDDLGNGVSQAGKLPNE